MGKKSGFFGFFGKKQEQKPRPRVSKPTTIYKVLPIRARYDSAQTTADNKKHWANIDCLSADAANSFDVRKTIRERARYETYNNGYALGIVWTYANDVIGSGPTLQMTTENSDFNNEIEKLWQAWAKEIKLARKLRTLRFGRTVDGESFGQLITNLKLKTPIKLDLSLVECDRVHDTSYLLPSPQNVDGVIFDEYDKPSKYMILKQHPGNLTGLGTYDNDYNEIDADFIIHWFREDRPGQHRGISELTSSLPLFAQLRRYTQAVFGAAESAADMAIVMATTSPPGGQAAEVGDGDSASLPQMEFEKNMMNFVPEGWEPHQIKAEQPSTVYDMFKNQIINEIARPLNMPFNIAACNSSSYNYASGRMDHQIYFKAIGIEQDDCDEVVMDKIFYHWMNEEILATGKERQMDYPHEWFWTESEHVDPVKEAQAQDIKLKNGTTTLADEWKKQGIDWEDKINLIKRINDKLKSAGISFSKDEKTKNFAESNPSDEEIINAVLEE